MSREINDKKQYYMQFLKDEFEVTVRFKEVFKEFKNDLNCGCLRVAEKKNDEWVVNTWIKEFILKGFKYGVHKEFFIEGQGIYYDKDTLGTRNITFEDNIRSVANNVSIRDGAYLAPGVICMPPSFVNIGAYVGEDTLIDSNALVGSCAQIGKQVHISAGTQIGGVLEPVRTLPVIVEDDVFIGGNCGIYDGVIIKNRCTIGAGTILTGSVSIYDIPNKRIISEKNGKPLVIEEGAVVVPGARTIACDAFDSVKIVLQTPVIIKYLKKDDRRIALEDLLRYSEDKFIF